MLANEADRTHPLRLTHRVRQQAGSYGRQIGATRNARLQHYRSRKFIHPVYLCRCRLMKIASKMIPPLITLCT